MKNNQLDIYHRAYKALESEAQKSELVTKIEKAIRKAGKSKEYMDTVRYRCVIMTDWIEKIEEGIPYIEEAIKQDRQFILQTGETVLIEKAKRISKASVEHLAHHSELITHEPEENQDIIPEKIYMAENINNYAVYENRFLFMLLNFINDFVGTRYTKIIEMWNKFHSELEIAKTVTIGKRTISYTATLSEDSVNDATTSYDKETIARIDRIRTIQQLVALLLQTPLMKEVSHSPMIKTPITRTNVLRMDNAFRNAVELFDFLHKYEGAGYIQQEMHQSYTAFPENIGGDFARVIAVSSYLTYRHGGKLDEEMTAEYEAEKRREREEKEKERKQKMEELRRLAKENKLSPEEYIVALEERVLGLEEERNSVSYEKSNFERLKQECASLKDKEEILKYDLERLGDKLKEEQTAREEDKGDFFRRIYELEQNRKTAEELHCSEMESMRISCEAQIKKITDEKERVMAEYDLCRARLHGLREEHGLMTPDDDFTSKESFAEIERESMAFKRFFDRQWDGTKKKIRQEIKAEMRKAKKKKED